jgi:DNA polymerase-3 subunit alpha
MTIDRALEITPELAELYKTDVQTKEIIDLAKKLEGCVRHVSVHAAGVLIAPKPLTEFTPLQFDPRGGKIITQYDMYTGNREGVVNLPKFDFLGIRNLTILEESVRLTKKVHGIDVNIHNLPYDDKKTYDMLARGETMGTFQLSGSGMTKYLKDLRPTTIEDINAMVALYRPGPMAFIPDYIERKRNPRLVKYIDPRLKEILESTFGIIIYQDDILLIATKLAGYSWGEADKFRKAVGKKIPEEMAKQEEKFISGCVDNGMKPAVAKELWEMIETFAAYGFNKAHAASYGNLAYEGKLSG